MLELVAADAAVLRRVVDQASASQRQGLGPHAYHSFSAATSQNAWAIHHQRRVALVQEAEAIASAVVYDLQGRLDGRAVRVCGIGSVVALGGGGDTEPARLLIERVVDGATRDGAALALLFEVPAGSAPPRDGWQVIAGTEVEVTVAESARHGAPMTMVRGGEERDLAAIAAMGQVRAQPFRFHLDRDAAFVKYMISRRRLQAGLSALGARQLEFVIAEEGVTAAAYVVSSVVGDTWTIEECGDRDASGARVGAILQALIAREPAERRPRIRARLPAGFVPPQLSLSPPQPAGVTVALRPLRPMGPALSLADVLYWNTDVL